MVAYRALESCNRPRHDRSQPLILPRGSRSLRSRVHVDHDSLTRLRLTLTAIMVTREALEQQKAYHSECIRIINTQLNALAPVSKLPPELLSNIFLDVAVRGSADPPRGQSRMVGRWIHVTHVCRSWRETALQCAPLWSHLHSSDSPKCIEEFLARSRDAPLSIQLCLNRLVPNTRQEDVLLLALSALHRVRRLDVHLNPYYDPTNKFLRRLGGRAPLLEALYIRTGESRR
ncbi:hypothetical protein C8Q72DRAFT_153835 [Fomitopsis betulina]|nr:hypothetical protein C8Q72DRAFT_153835 [Fomitopsis betulina]